MWGTPNKNPDYSLTIMDFVVRLRSTVKISSSGTALLDIPVARECVGKPHVFCLLLSRRRRNLVKTQCVYNLKFKTIIVIGSINFDH